ncbi:MAG: DEAD/DEAH box helicase family protein [Candidatus Microthrix sp.]|nr:DEAD/DEAH box helicase family protein [Candidatus Microthrix sp.]MBK6502437.1 DEAD/DEAH box helicase family protein [Candidatus Microthrix sp.]
MPPSRKGHKQDTAQTQIDFDVTGRRREQNSLINDIRQRVGCGATTALPVGDADEPQAAGYWSGTDGREEPMLFCQREAAETAIYLAEVAGRHGRPRSVTRLNRHNATHNAGLNRTALKMATGSSKTIVMGMLIAWQTINKSATPRDVHFANQFLIVTPGVSIHDRLRCCNPPRTSTTTITRSGAHPELWPLMLEAQIHVTNYHTSCCVTPRRSKG